MKCHGTGSISCTRCHGTGTTHRIATTPTMPTIFRQSPPIIEPSPAIKPSQPIKFSDPQIPKVNLDYPIETNIGFNRTVTQPTESFTDKSWGFIFKGILVIAVAITIILLLIWLAGIVAEATVRSFELLRTWLVSILSLGIMGAVIWVIRFLVEDLIIKKNLEKGWDKIWRSKDKGDDKPKDR